MNNRLARGDTLITIILTGDHKRIYSNGRCRERVFYDHHNILSAIINTHCLLTNQATQAVNLVFIKHDQYPNLVTATSTYLGKTFITRISYIHHHHWWLPGDLFHLLDSSMQSRIHEGEQFPLHDIVYDKAFAPGNVVCHPVIE